jgi:hypothetical protein
MATTFEHQSTQASTIKDRMFRPKFIPGRVPELEVDRRTLRSV